MLGADPFMWKTAKYLSVLIVLVLSSCTIKNEYSYAKVEDCFIKGADVYLLIRVEGGIQKNWETWMLVGPSQTDRIWSLQK